MRKVLAGLTAAAFVIALAAPAFAATQTVQGQVIDRECYLHDTVNNKGDNHKMPKDVAACATICAKKGLPLALLTTDGKVYTITGGLAADNNAKLIAHITHTVSITGDVTTDKDGKMSISSDALKMVSR
jgi:acid phosphatase class B